MKKLILFFAIIFFITNNIFAIDIFVRKIDTIPNGITETEGIFEKGYTWQDKNGTNFFIYTKKRNIAGSNNNRYTSSLFIYCYHYKKTNNNYTLIRKIVDVVYGKKKDVDNIKYVYLDIEENGFIFTDIDNDGYAEITFLYTKDKCVNNDNLNN